MDNKALVGIVLATSENQKIMDLVHRYGKTSEWNDVVINVEDSDFEIDKLFKELKKRNVDDVLNFGICEVVATLRIEDTREIIKFIDIINKYFIDAEITQYDKENARISLCSLFWSRLYNTTNKYEVAGLTDSMQVIHDKVLLNGSLYYLDFDSNTGWIDFIPSNKDDDRFRAACIFFDEHSYEIMYEPDLYKYQNDNRVRIIAPRDSVLFTNDEESYWDCDDYWEDEDDFKLNTNGTY